MKNLYIFLSTPSGWRATTNNSGDLREYRYISIHALRVEGDGISTNWRRHTATFLSTPSGWRATDKITTLCYNKNLFLSTPSGWRATVKSRGALAHVCISIHALRVEGDFFSGEAGLKAVEISIHALRVEGDTVP